MSLSNLVIRSKLIPPRQRRGGLRRARLEKRLRAVLDYPLTIVQANTGYGKTSALASLGAIVENLFWYTITDLDRDPLLFLAHLVAAFDQKDKNWSRRTFEALEAYNGRVDSPVLTPLLNDLTTNLTSEAILVLDDFHVVQDIAEIDRIVCTLIEYHPPKLHIVISSRQTPPFENLTRWRAKGQVFNLGRNELAFTAEEIEALFSQYYGLQLLPQQVTALSVETEGWIIALQLIWQSLQSETAPTLDDVLERLPDSLEALFDYLAPEVLTHQSQAVQDFLVNTAVLDQMDAAACDALLAICLHPPEIGSAVLLRRLYEFGLFVNAIGEGTYRYQHMFQSFLLSRLKNEPERLYSLHRCAASHYEKNSQPEEAIYHLLKAGLYGQAAAMIEATGPDLVRLGRLDRLLGWMEQLPAEIQAGRPALNLLAGDVLRLRADFEGALVRYLAAEKTYAIQGDNLGRSQALRGQAQVYLDTLRPLKADSLLEEASSLLEPQEHRQETAALFDQIAENKLNLGYPQQAQALHMEAQLLRAEADPGDLYLEARALLRTGNLEEAQRLLEIREREERQSGADRPPRFHRETVLLLSLVCILRGEQVAAERLARDGIEIGQALHSDFVQAVGYMRLGHALEARISPPWQSQNSDEAIACYRKSIELVQPFKVTRVLVEPFWGLCHAFGYRQDLQLAHENALKAIEVAEQAGDVWIGNLVRVSLGSSYVKASQPRLAREWLDLAVGGFEQVKDSFEQVAALIWLTLNAWWQGDTVTAVEYLRQILPVAREHHLDELLIHRTYLGLDDDQAFLPLLIEAGRMDIEGGYVQSLLKTLELDTLQDHPGYTLWVRTFGEFSVWRGNVAITSQEWQREKARQLLQLFIAHRGQFIQRDQIIEMLWPDRPVDAALRDFKVALNSANHALEPARPRDVQPFFITRHGNAYGINPKAAVIVDAYRFEDQAEGEGIEALKEAIALYQDQFLPDCLYDDWAAHYRERLDELFLKVSGRLADHWLSEQEWARAIETCQSALAHDPCWEPAYRQLIQAYIGQGNHPQAQAVYNRCVETLKNELNVEPSTETRLLLDLLHF